MSKFIRISLAVIVLLVSVLNPLFSQTNSVSAEEVKTTYTDGEYKVPYEVFHATKDEKSIADGYFTKPAKVVIKEGKIKVKIEYDPSITELKVNTNPVTIVSEENNKVVAEFTVDSLEDMIQTEVHVVIPSIKYDHWYTLRFDFDASNIPPAVVEEEMTPIADGNYTFDYQVLKENTDEASSMGKYLSKPAKLLVENQKQYMIVTLSSSNFVTELKTELNGQLVDAEVLEEDAANQTKVLKIQIDDISKMITASLKMSYGMSHVVRIVPDKTTLTEVPATETPGTTDPGEGNGETPGTTDPEEGNGETPGTTDPGEESGETPGTSTDEEKEQKGILADGEYTIPYTVLHGTENEKSKVDDSFVKPGKLVVRDGKIYAQLEMQKGNIKELLVNSKAVKVIESNDKTQTIEFLIEDISKLVIGQVHIIVDAIGYDHWYDIRFQFDTSDLPFTEEFTGEQGGTTGGSESDNESDTDSEQVNTSDETKSENADNESKTDDLAYDRNADEKSDAKHDKSKSSKVANAKTSDVTPFMWYLALMIGSLFVIAKKVRTKTL